MATTAFRCPMKAARRRPCLTVCWFPGLAPGGRPSHGLGAVIWHQPCAAPRLTMPMACPPWMCCTTSVARACRPGVAPAPRPAPSSHGSAPPPAPHRQHRILGGRAGQRNRLHTASAPRGSRRRAIRASRALRGAISLSKATASLTASASGPSGPARASGLAHDPSVDEVADRSSRSSGFGPRNREEAGDWRRRRRRGCLKQIGVSLRQADAVHPALAGSDLTSVIKRPGWSLRSASFSTCRPSATARSAAAAILI